VTSYGKDLMMILTNRMLPGIVMCRWEKKTGGSAKILEGSLKTLSVNVCPIRILSSLSTR
jgi:hypothetical protein